MLPARQTTRPAPETHRPRPSEVGRILRAAHPGIPDLHSARPAIVVHEDDERLSIQLFRLEHGQQPAKIVIDVLDHAKELRRIWRNLARVELLVLRRDIEWCVRRVGRNEREEWSPLHLTNPPHRPAEEDIGTVPLRRLEDPVVKDDRIEV